MRMIVTMIALDSAACVQRLNVAWEKGQPMDESECWGQSSAVHHSGLGHSWLGLIFIGLLEQERTHSLSLKHTETDKQSSVILIILDLNRKEYFCGLHIFPFGGLSHYT